MIQKMFVWTLNICLEMFKIFSNYIIQTIDEGMTAIFANAFDSALQFFPLNCC